MARIQDSLGRIVEHTGSIQEMKELLKSLLQGNVTKSTISPAVQAEKKDKQEKFKKIHDLLKKIDKNLDEELKQEEKNAKSIIEAIKNYQLNRGETKKNTTARKMKDAVSSPNLNKNLRRSQEPLLSLVKIQKAAYKRLDLLVKEATKAGSIYTRAISTDNKIDESNEILKEGLSVERATAEAIRDPGTSQTVAAAGAGGGGGGGGGSAATPTISEQATQQANSLVRTATILSGISTAIAGNINIWEHLFSGVVSQEVSFMVNMRQIAFQTKGITADTEGLQNQWANIGSRVEAVRETGQHLNVIQKQYEKNARRGIKSQKELLEVTKTGLNLATMIGSDVGQTADTLYDWHVAMKLNNNQVSQLARGIRDVAMNVGITGDRLLEAVKTSEKFVVNMRNAGTLSADAAANVIELVAASQKAGVGDKISEVLEATTSTVSLFTKASPQIQSLLFGAASRMGRLAELQQGTINNSKEGMKDLAKGIQQQVEAAAGVKMEDFSKLSPDRLKNVNLQLSAAFGIEANEAKIIIEQMIESSKTVGERIGDITKKLQNQNLTEEERLNLLKQESGLKLSTGFKFLNKFGEVAKDLGTSNIDQALKEFQKTMTPDQFRDIQKELSAIGVKDTGSVEGMLKGAAKLTAEQLKAAGGTDYTGQVMAAIRSNNVGELRDILTSMDKEQKKIGAEEAQTLDPVSEAAKWTKETNAAIRSVIAPLLLSLLTASGIMIFHLGAMAAGIAAMAFQANAGLIAGGGVRGLLGKAGGFLAPVATGLRAIFGVVTKFPGPTALVVGAVLGLFQAFKSAYKAAEVYGIAQEKVTADHRIAAGAAGFLTGILNVLTFGVFSDLFGATGKLTKILAQGLLPVISILTMPFKILWGVLKGIGLLVKNVLIGAWEGIKIAFEPVVELWTFFKDTMKDLFEPFSEIFAMFGGTGDVAGVLASAIGFVGKAIGMLLKGVGYLIKFALMPFVIIIKGIVKLFATKLKPIIEAIAEGVKNIISVFDGLYKIFHGIFTFNPEEIWTGIKKVVVGILIKPFQILGNMLYNVIIKPFVKLGETIKGILSWIPGIGSDEEVPKAASGGYVEESGLAVIHKGETITPARDRFGTATASSMSDLHHQIQQRYALQSGGASVGLASSELVEISKYSEIQTVHLAQINKTLVDLLKTVKSDDSRTGNTGRGQRESTKSNVVPKGSTNYYSWQFGKYQDGAHKQILNDGVT